MSKKKKRKGSLQNPYIIYLRNLLSFLSSETAKCYLKEYAMTDGVSHFIKLFTGSCLDKSCQFKP